jgi:hypothetical protein
LAKLLLEARGGPSQTLLVVLLCEETLAKELSAHCILTVAPTEKGEELPVAAADPLSPRRTGSSGSPKAALGAAIGSGVRIDQHACRWGSIRSAKG